MAFSNMINFLYTLLSLVAVSNAARVLAIFPIAAKSHFLCDEGMVRSLYDAGHQITIVSPFPNEKSLQNYTVIDTSSDTFIYVGQSSLHDFKSISAPKIMYLMGEIEQKSCNDVLKRKEVQDILNSKEKLFDVMVVEIMQMCECFLPLAEKLDIPVIGIVTLRSWKLADSLIGNPYNLATIPYEFNEYSDKMMFYDRLRNTWSCLINDWFYYFAVKSKLNDITQQHYPVHLLHKKKISLVFNNNHPSLMPRPLAPNVIEIGGIHMKPANTLPQDIEQFIEESEQGVILFTFGSVVKSSTMDPNTVKAFTDAFAAIPQRVIWKFEDKIDDLPDNVRTMSWVPQRDILAHKNIKAFIGHCGISGTYEAISEGKPMVLTPLFGDQRSNAAILQQLGVGVYLDVYSATKESILEALNAVINDTRYRDNMEELSRRFKDRPMTPQESVVFWTEYVIRHKGALHLRTVAADMPLYQYLLLDVILFMIAVTSVILYVVFYVVKKLYVTCFENKKYFVSIEFKKKC